MQNVLTLGIFLSLLSPAWAVGSEGSSSFIYGFVGAVLGAVAGGLLSRRAYPARLGLLLGVLGVICTPMLLVSVFPWVNEPGSETAANMLLVVVQAFLGLAPGLIARLTGQTPG